MLQSWKERKKGMRHWIITIEVGMMAFPLAQNDRVFLIDGQLPQCKAGPQSAEVVQESKSCQMLQNSAANSELETEKSKPGTK